MHPGAAMQACLLLILSSCSLTSSTFSSSSLNSSFTSRTSHFPLSIPRPLLPYFRSVSKASKRQPRHELTTQEESDKKSDFGVDFDNKVEANFTEAGLKMESLGLQVPQQYKKTKIQLYKYTKRQKYNNTKRQKYKNTKIQKDKKTKRQNNKNGKTLNDKKTKWQNDKKAKRQKDKKLKTKWWKTKDKMTKRWKTKS